MTKIYIPPGHGGKSHPGAAANGIVEKDINLTLSLALRDELLSRFECEVKMSREKDVYVSLADRVREANTWGADLFFELHSNGFGDSRVRGFETFIHTQPYTRTVAFQKAFHPFPAKVWTDAGSRDRGKKRANFYVLRETDMSAIMIENGFLTNKQDAALLKDACFQARLVTATADGIASAMKLKKKPEPQKYAPHLYRVIVDGKQLHALRELDNLTGQVLKHVQEGVNELLLQKVNK